LQNNRIDTETAWKKMDEKERGEINMQQLRRYFTVAYFIEAT